MLEIETWQNVYFNLYIFNAQFNKQQNPITKKKLAHFSSFGNDKNHLSQWHSGSVMYSPSFTF